MLNGVVAPLASVLNCTVQYGAWFGVEGFCSPLQLGNAEGCSLVSTSLCGHHPG